MPDISSEGKNPRTQPVEKGANPKGKPKAGLEKAKKVEAMEQQLLKLSMMVQMGWMASTMQQVSLILHATPRRKP